MGSQREKGETCKPQLLEAPVLKKKTRVNPSKFPVARSRGCRRERTFWREDWGYREGPCIKRIVRTVTGNITTLITLRLHDMLTTASLSFVHP